VLITRFRDISTAGDGIEMVVWRVAGPVPPSSHGYKYRLVYVASGKRVIGFDNERGKGDHCHVDGEERTYRFIDIDRLIGDFIAEVDKWKNAN
jgi:hypothetical protein